MAVALGAYTSSVSVGERVSFVMNYPATGTEVGGPSMRALTGHVSASLDKAGFAKRLMQSNVIDVASHVVLNSGSVERHISFETSGFPEATEWHSRDKDFNPVTHAIDRPIAPGEAVDLSLRVTFPRPLPAEEVLLEGSILVVDTETGKTLSELPVHVYRSGTGTQGSCCE
ncbi:MAG: hypothetical protein Q8K89_11620 [Actinomycetota bacterium]|nr:hypothetical protein [Actinomycetota bacterium]